MKLSQKQQKNLFSSDMSTQPLHHFPEFKRRDYQTEIASQFGITLHSTQKVRKMEKPT
ncbi:hypothetical protein [Gracilibacillus ureilyticus]|uniref:hypothetical protein n=1 Tax=Gracilibacillus ureilyticus TaxID=531814 RepID=UPI0015876658|nr:hypothetical protein [Gracilibacillus ureilyticus]